MVTRYQVLNNFLTEEEYLDGAAMAALDHTHFLAPGMPLPALTTLLHKVCDNDPVKFEEACRLIKLIQIKTLTLGTKVEAS